MLLTELMLFAMLTLSLSGISAIFQYLILLLVLDVNKMTEYVSVRTSQVPFTFKITDHPIRSNINKFSTTHYC